MPDFRVATEAELWSFLKALSGETQYRLYNGLDTGNTQEQGEQAWEALKELNRRFLYTWASLEQELRRRAFFIWLYRVAPMPSAGDAENGWEDAVLNDTGPVIAVLLGTEREARAKREFHAMGGVDQTL